MFFALSNGGIRKVWIGVPWFNQLFLIHFIKCTVSNKIKSFKVGSCGRSMLLIKFQSHNCSNIFLFNLLLSEIKGTTLNPRSYNNFRISSTYFNKSEAVIFLTGNKATTSLNFDKSDVVSVGLFHYYVVSTNNLFFIKLFIFYLY